MCRCIQDIGERWELNPQHNPVLRCFLCADELPMFAAPLWVWGIWGWGLGLGLGLGWGLGASPRQGRLHAVARGVQGGRVAPAWFLLSSQFTRSLPHPLPKSAARSQPPQEIV